MSRMCGILGITTLLLLAVGTAAAQSPADVVTANGTLVYVAGTRVTSPDGATVYQASCAVCHGPTGQGDGRAARYLQVPVPDLTRIAVRDGRFSPSHVVEHIQNVGPRHPSQMPSWGRHLRLPSDDPASNRLIVYNLTRYLESMQVDR